MIAIDQKGKLLKHLDQRESHMGGINCWSVHHNGKSAHFRKLRAGHDGEGNDRRELDPMVCTVINHVVFCTLYSIPKVYLLSTPYRVGEWIRRQTIVTAVKPSMSQTDPFRPIIANLSASVHLQRSSFFGLLSESQPITTEYLYLYGVRHLVC